MPKILLVEDNKLNQLVGVKTLTKLGYAVDVVDDGTKAVEACTSGDFDAILMDIQMPGLDGYEATAKIREHEATNGSGHVPIIGLSARAMDGDHEAAIAAGLDEYLTKPLRTEELRAVLRRSIPESPVDS